MMSEFVQFKAIIRQHGTMNAAYIEFPFSAEQVFGKKGQVKIKAIFDDRVEYRGSLARMKSECHMLGLPKDIRNRLGKTFGDEVSVSLTEDKKERIVEIADDIASLFAEHPEVRILFDEMSYTHRKEYIRWIEEAKKHETRENRKIKMIEMILNGKKGV
jgi:hypothetical protein